MSTDERRRRPRLFEERTGYRSGDPRWSSLDASGGGPGRKENPGEDGPIPCDLCGAPMIDRHCKLSCPQCGYQRDCSDP